MKQLLFIFLLSMMTGCMLTPPPPPKVVKPEGQPLPEFNILLKDTVTRINTKKIPAGKPLILFFYGQNCDPCKTLMANLTAHMDSVPDVRWYMLSADYFHNLGVYEDQFHLSRFDNVVSGQDMPGVFFSYFGSNVFPFTVVYDKQKKLKQIVVGLVSLDSINKVVTR